MKSGFTTSCIEMDRRKRAFQTLVTSFVFSSFSFCLVLFPACLWTIVIILLVFTVLSATAISIFNRLFEGSKQIRIIISDNKIERVCMAKQDSYLISEITGISIKRNIKNLIREIHIKTANSGSLYINGLNNFEDFKECLLKETKDGISIKNTKEPLDFDHPLFYVIFGAFIGILSVLLLKYTLSLSLKDVASFQVLVGGFTLLFGIYWLVSKPIVGRYGKNKRLFDMAIGTLMILIAFGIIWISRIII